MPKDTAIQRVLVIGPGPYRIGRGTDEDFAVVEVCRTFKREGCDVIVLHNQSASLTTDAAWVDRVYMEPLAADRIREVVVREEPHLLVAAYGDLPAVAMVDTVGIEGVKTDIPVKIYHLAQNRGALRQLLAESGLPLVPGVTITQVAEAALLAKDLKFPLIVRPFASQGGLGSSVVYNHEELEEAIQQGLSISTLKEVALEKALIGWEAVDVQLLCEASGEVRLIALGMQAEPVEVHRGNSLALTPSGALQSRFTAWLAAARPLFEALAYAGPLHVRLACQPEGHDIYVLDLHPRLMLQPAWRWLMPWTQAAEASAKLALGYTLAEIFPDESGGKVSVQDEVAVTLPVFDFQRFGAEDRLGSVVQSAGTALAVGGNGQEALQKAVRALAGEPLGFGADPYSAKLEEVSDREIREKLVNANSQRLFYIRQALKSGMNLDEVRALTQWNRAFLSELAELYRLEKELTTYALYNLPPDILWKAKRSGFSDRQLAYLLRVSEADVRKAREKHGIEPRRLKVTAAGRGSGKWFTTTYAAGEAEPGSPSKTPGVLVVGAGVNRMLYGSEYDWNLMRAARGLREAGYRVVLLTPVSPAVLELEEAFDRIYMDAVTLEDILNIAGLESVEGVILQYGGETALDLADVLVRCGIRILGNEPDDLRSLAKMRLRKEGVYQARQIDNETQWEQMFNELARSDVDSVLTEPLVPEAIGVMIGCVGDGKNCVVAGVAEQIEEAGIHPGDSAFSSPPYSLNHELIGRMERFAAEMVRRLAIRGWIEWRFAVKHDRLYLISADPSANAMVLFFSRATGVDWAAEAAKILVGGSLDGRLSEKPQISGTAVKEAVFSFKHFPGMDPVLGTEKHSTGMVIGIDADFGTAFIRSQLAVGEKIPVLGRVYLSIRSQDLRPFIGVAEQLADLGFTLAASQEIAVLLKRNGIDCESVYNLGEGRPHILDRMKNGEIQWFIHLPSDSRSQSDERLMRCTAIAQGIPVITTLSGALAAVNGVRQYIRDGLKIRPSDRRLLS